jgi:hypothetical protein
MEGKEYPVHQLKGGRCSITGQKTKAQIAPQKRIMEIER